MAEVITTSTSKTKTIRKNVKIDMTPMVDLGFLLITFFIFTTSMAEPVGMNLIVPKESSGDTYPTEAEKTLTILLHKNNTIFTYKGTWERARKENGLTKTGFHFSGVGNIIRQHQLALGSEKEDLTVLIKPLKEASYKNLIDILDEMQINNVKRYALVPTMQEEVEFAARQ